jgi:hypothetical protein
MRRLERGHSMCERLISVTAFHGCPKSCNIASSFVKKRLEAESKVVNCPNPKEQILGQSKSFVQCPNRKDRGALSARVLWGLISISSGRNIFDAQVPTTVARDYECWMVLGGVRLGFGSAVIRLLDYDQGKSLFLSPVSMNRSAININLT